MVIIETPAFTRQVLQLLGDDRYRTLQVELTTRPDRGSVIQGTGGIRKMRWSITGGGKRGGVRVLYYWRAQADQILMLLIYSKSTKDDLTPAEKKALKRIVENW